MAASYPGSVKSFTVRVAGDTIQPAIVNDLQDEVAAIEAGLLNGTAPLSSSNASAINLSVSGNSTITGTLTVGTIVSTSISAAVGVTSYVKAFLSSVTSISSGASTAVVGLDSKTADLLDEFEVATFTFTPKSSGYYSIIGRTLQPSMSGKPGMAITVNSNQVGRASCQQLTAGPAGLCVSLLLNLSSGAAGAVQMLYSNGADGSTSSLSTGHDKTTLEILRIY